MKGRSIFAALCAAQMFFSYGVAEAADAVVLKFSHTISNRACATPPPRNLQTRLESTLPGAIKCRFTRQDSSATIPRQSNS